MDSYGPQLCPSYAWKLATGSIRDPRQARLRVRPQARQRSLAGLLHGSGPGLPPGSVDLPGQGRRRGLASGRATSHRGRPVVAGEVAPGAVRRATEAFGPYAEEWLAHRELKPRTRSLYRRQLDRFLLPAFGEVSLRDITPAVVRTWYSRLDPNRPTQRAQSYALMRSILSTAVADEILAANPCRIRGAESRTRSDGSSRPASTSWRSSCRRCPTGCGRWCCWAPGAG